MNKPTYKFQCIDDDEVSAEPLCNRLKEAAEIGVLEIERRDPMPWEEEIASIISGLETKKFCGTLLDYRLDEKAKRVPDDATVRNPDEVAVPVSYTADSLLQELRRRSVTNQEASSPIILWSNANRLEEFHRYDPNYRFHYDLTIDKEKIAAKPTELSDRLIALARGYAAIRAAHGKPDTMNSLLAAPYPDATKSMDAFFKNQYPTKAYGYHIALFIIHEILEVDGPLIGEQMLRALIAVEPSEISGKAFLTEMQKHRYSGVFADGFIRYWKVSLLGFLDSLAGATGGWLKLDAESRAEALARRFKLKKLKAIPPIASKYSSIYDTVCVATGSPLNRMNGFVLFDECPRVWKAARYISTQALRKTFGVTGNQIRLDEGEKRRYMAMFDASSK